MEPISGVIIAFNEERNIARALRSLEPWCAELLVVDSGSTDRTREIAAANGARVVGRAFTSFIDQKNFALAAAAHEWVLSLDADEELVGEAREVLPSVDFSRTSVLYSFPRRNHYLGGWVDRTDWRHDEVIRLFHRGRARFAGSLVHPSVQGEGCSRRRLPAVVRHWPFRDLEHHLEKLNAYTTTMAGEMTGISPIRVLFKLVFDPPWKFFRMYLIEGGVLMGTRGFVLSVTGAVYTFYKYAKIWERGRSRRD